jgi:hypothetical protein
MDMRFWRAMKLKPCPSSSRKPSSSRRMAASSSRSLKSAGNPRKSRTYGSRKTRSGVIRPSAPSVAGLLHDGLGAPGDGGALVEHARDLLLEGPGAPGLEAAQLDVEAALEGVIEGDQLAQMGPAQL